MADTLTPNYNWVKPEVGASPTTWGDKINANLDLIDAQVHANQTAIASGGSSIGDIKMFAGPTPPTNWLSCDGTVYQNSQIPLLAPILANIYGGVPGVSNAVPNLSNKFPIGPLLNVIGLGYQGGESTHLLAASEMPAHAHPIVDVVHNHGVNQTPHGHADPGHTHPGSQDAHQHNVSLPGSFGYGIGGVAPPDPLVNQGATNVVTDVRQPNVTVGAASANLATANANISLNASGTGLSTTQNAGGGGAHNNMPPYVCVNFVIRYQ